jgi:hypothetical protein
MLQANPTISPADIYTGISLTAAPMVNPSPGIATGYGFIQAGAALAWPNMSVSPTSIALGQSATLTWNAASINTCTGSGGFSTTAISGTMTVSPTAAGTTTFTMKCINTAGSATENVMLMVQGAPGGKGGGGGALDESTLLALAALGLLRSLRSLRAAAARRVA